MTICDLSPLYCEKAGGIRTYHRARIEWFRQQTRHRYVLVSAGSGSSVTRVTQSVSRVLVYGLPLSRDRDGYRLLLDYRAVRGLIDEIRPDILQVNDPWISTPLGLLLRRQGAFRGLLTAFCHSDPVTTYIEPRLNRLVVGRRIAVRLASRVHDAFNWMQKQFDMTFVASEAMQTRLQRAGVQNVRRAGFGIDPGLLAMRRWRAGAGRLRRLLYVGRLDEDKEFGLVLDLLPELLRRPDVLITIIGTGAHRPRLERLSHPRLRYLGFVSDPLTVRRVYAANDILLAPGRFETFGLAALEAAAAGLVVVGPDHGGTGELLQQMRSTLAFRAGDRQEFLERTVAAIEGDIAELSERGREVAARYGSWSEAVARHVALYESILSENDGTEARRLPA